VETNKALTEIAKSYQTGDGRKDLLHERGPEEDPDGVRRHQEQHLGTSSGSYRDARGNTPGGGESDENGNADREAEGTHPTVDRREGNTDEIAAKEDRRREGPQGAFTEEAGPTPRGAARGSSERRGGDTENSNRGTKEHANTGAKEEETGGRVDHRVIRPETEGEIPSKTRDTREDRRAGRSRKGENVQWTQHPRNWRPTRPGGKPKRRIAAFRQPGRGAEEETGGNFEEETGGQGDTSRKIESHDHTHRVGKRMEAGGNGAGHLGEKQMVWMVRTREQFTAEVKMLSKRVCKDPNKQNVVLTMDANTQEECLKRKRAVVGLTFWMEEKFEVNWCFNCHGYGHQKKDCRQELTCYKCGGATSRQRRTPVRTASERDGKK
jgi:hypothetical protein